MRPCRAVAAFDSASAMLRALSRFLHGRDTPLLGQLPGAAEPALAGLLGAVNRLPRRLQEPLYAWSGWAEAVPAGRIGELRAAELAEWAVSHYPRRRAPALLIGSSNGAAVHLAAALGAPWLPQTLLIPVRQREIHPDEPGDDLRAAEPAARALLDANPELALHHMHDANQDRLMIRHMTYFRVKWLSLPAAYERFIEDTLEPGGTLLVLDCRLRWPTTRLGERHVFQHGALGGITDEEYRHGSPRVADYLARYGSHRRSWRSPEPDGHSPEAEWGFEPSLLPDLELLARRRGYRLRRIGFTDPEHLSELVADLYRWWNRRRGLPGDRLLVESFVLLEPWWALRTGAAPFWMEWNSEPSLRSLTGYLDRSEPFDEIRMALFSHGVESAGLVPIEGWRTQLDRATKLGAFVGVDERAFPRDFAVFARFHRELARTRRTYPLPLPLPTDDLADFLEERSARYEVDWAADPDAGS